MVPNGQFDFTQSNKEALDTFVQGSVTMDMIEYLADKARGVIKCETSLSSLPSPPASPPYEDNLCQDETIPTVEEFISSLVERSRVQVSTLMTALVYLSRLQERLPPIAKGMRCTVHRIFLASLILSAKNLNDSSPKNKHWARYSNVRGYEGFGFSLTEVNLMEKQLLFLLDWDLNISSHDLYQHFEPFLAPIRAQLYREQEEAQALLVLREHEAQQRKLRSLKKSYTSYSSLPQVSISRPVTPNDHDYQRSYSPLSMLQTPPQTCRSRSSSRTGVSSLSNKRSLDRSRSRSTHRRSFVSFDRMTYPTPPPSGHIPELARSGSISSVSSQCSSPMLPSPTMMTHNHALPGRSILANMSLKKTNNSFPTEKPSKRTRAGILTRFWSGGKELRGEQRFVQ